MDRRETLRRIAREAKPYAPQIVAALILGTVAGLLNIVPTWAFRVIVNGVLTPHKGAAPNQGLLYIGLGAIVASLVLANLATYYETYITAWSGQRLIANLRLRLFQHILRLPLERFDRWRPGELITRFSNDLQLMTDAVSISFPQMVVAVVTFVSSFAVMLYLDWLLTLILVVVAPVISVAVSRFQKLISNGTKRTQARIADLSSNLTEILQGQRVVKAFGRENREVDRFHNRNEDMFGAYLKLTQFINTQPLVVSTMMIVAVVVIVWLSIREVLVGRLNTGSVFQYWLLLVNLANPLNRLAAFFGDIAKAIVGAGRVFEILDLPTEEHDRPDAQPLRDVRGRIDFEHVSFAYGGATDETHALHDITAHVAAGEIVALVGPSGAGKTTFANLVPRFYLPQQGRITIDGHDVADVRLGDLRDAIGIVPQDPQLFRDSVMENVRYGRLDATDDEVRAAAREANADQFIVQLPMGYDTEVGERGARLSGGERQRIAIARAIVRDPRILILDEATSALDSESEGLIEEALDRLLPGRTTLIIAHRLSTIRRAHRIFYLEDGRIVETGSHEELLAKGGAYARMYARQFGSAQLEESAGR
jgi:subfamily B ATP-binding cassette protein MsbA